jgi:predicted nucleic acid-binding protein
MIFDTDVLIWALRGHPLALETIEEDEDRYISVAVNMELVYRVRDNRELRELRSFLKMFPSLPLSEAIGRRALRYLEDLALKVGIDPMDTIIAATAVEHDLTLCTGNVKHYRHVPELKLSPFDRFAD